VAEVDVEGGIDVPEAIRGPFEQLSRMASAEIDSVRAWLGAQAPVDGGSELLRRLTGPSLPPGSREALLATLAALGLRRILGWTVDRVAKELASSKSLSISDEERRSLEERLATLGKTDAVWISTRATDIASDAERTFHDARTITSVRPVLPHTRTDEATAGVLVHELTLLFHPNGDEGETEQFRVMLQPRDIARLQRILTRATEKAAATVLSSERGGVVVLNGSTE